MRAFRAEFRRDGKRVRTRFYPTPQAAQAQLEKRIGNFEHLEAMFGDPAMTNSSLLAARRLGGIVTVREKKP